MSRKQKMEVAYGDTESILNSIYALSSSPMKDKMEESSEELDKVIPAMAAGHSLKEAEARVKPMFEAGKESSGILSVAGILDSTCKGYGKAQLCILEKAWENPSLWTTEV